MIPTAKEFFKEQLSGETLTEESVIEGLIDFAKLHVEAALKRAYQNQGMSWTNSKDEEVKKDLFIRNSYPLTNIK